MSRRVIIDQWAHTPEGMGAHPPFINLALFDDGSAIALVRTCGTGAGVDSLPGEQVQLPLDAARVRQLASTLSAFVARVERLNRNRPEAA